MATICQLGMRIYATDKRARFTREAGGVLTELDDEGIDSVLRDARAERRMVLKQFTPGVEDQDHIPGRGSQSVTHVVVAALQATASIFITYIYVIPPTICLHGRYCVLSRMRCRVRDRR